MRNPQRSTLKNLLPVMILLLVNFALLPARPQQQPGAEPGWAQARDEAINILAGMVKIDSSNPPGNETKVAEYIKAILDKEGIAAEILELTPGRGNIVARLKGNGKKQPLLLMGHTDVVGVERDKWTVDPFGAVIKDGFIYGRGSSDDKGMAAACLEVFLLLHRLKVPLDRDVILLAEAGEEGTTQVGIDFMVSKHWDKIGCEFALNEGGMIYSRGGRIQYVGIATTEKVSRGMRLIARGTSGHGSMPRPDNPITHLAAAVAKVGNLQMPMRLNETTRTFFDRLAAVSTPEEAGLFRALMDPARSAEAQEKIRLTNVMYNSMLRTSISPTIIKGGFRSNVIPGEAEATLDIRALPDEDVPALVARIRELIQDPLVEVIPPSQRGRPANPPSGLDTDLFRAMERVQTKMFPQSVTLPLMVTGATDSAQLRARGVQAYGLGGVVTDDERLRVHGHDERLSIEGMGRFIEFIYRSVQEVAAGK
jgi:acetylornithine deacetylase/succinyl-diaminopimelate desuccinylase-like protein